jgi:uncharacterized protein
MTTYFDSSALLKRYVAESDSQLAHQLFDGEPVRVTSWITVTEVRRNLARLLTGASLRRARTDFERDVDAMAMVSATEDVCRRAAALGEEYGVRSLDALHLASAQVLAITDIAFATWDLRQAHTARVLGMRVVGV